MDPLESPAVAIALRLHERLPGRVLAHDPFTTTHDPLTCADLETVLAQDLIVVLVKHRVYRELPITAWQRPILDLVGMLREPPP